MPSPIRCGKLSVAALADEAVLGPVAVARAPLTKGSAASSSSSTRYPDMATSSFGTPSMGIAKFLEKLDDADGKVRAEAVKALGQFASRADPVVTSALLGRLVDKNKLVRKCAVEALAQVTKRGDDEVVSALLGLLSHDIWFVRQAAASCFGRSIAMRGDVRVVEGLLGLLKDDREETVCEALDALSAVGRVGDGAVASALIAHLKSETGEWLTKPSAVRALAEVADRGDVEAVAALIALLDEPREEVRQAVIAAVPRIALPGDRELASALGARVTGGDVGAPDARAAAAILLGHVLAGAGTGGAQEEASVLRACVRDSSECWLVRRACIDALARAAPRGDRESVAAVAPCVADADSGVRQAAVVALGSLAARGDREATLALLSVLRGGEHAGMSESLPFVRLAAAQSLGKVARVGDAASVKVLLAGLNDPHAGVRDAAAEALKHVSEQGDDLVVEALLDELLAD